MISIRHFLGLLAIAGLSAFSASAQLAISARAGMINYTEGSVSIDGKEVVARNSEFPQVNEGQVLKTEEGRAEILLTPGVFLRVAEDSSIKMVSNRLSDTRVLVEHGSAIVECAEIGKENAVTILTGDAQLTFHKPGVFRVDAGQQDIKTYAGEAVVTKSGQMLTLKDGKMTSIAGVLAPEKFDNKVGDAFFRWAARRADAIAMANVAAARSVNSNYQSRSGFWQFNPYFGYFTFVPGMGFYRSFFGPSFYSPSYVWYLSSPGYYSRGYYNYGGGGYGNSSSSYNPAYGYNTVMSRGSVGYSGVAPSASPAPAAPAASGGAARVGDSGAGRGGSGGRAGH
jgi:hypothetical protein